MNALLALDTSSPVLSLALRDCSGKIHVRTVNGLMSHAEKILVLIDELLSSTSTPFVNVGAFLIGKGPGSFTGLRVSFATIKGFLAVSEVPCYGALSLDLIAENPKFRKLPEGTNLAVALDAFRERVYFRVYTRKNGSWIPSNETGVLSAEETVRALPAEVHVTGNALAKYRAAFDQAAGKKIHFAPEEDWYPKAETMIELFDKKDPKLEQINRRQLLPFYFRLSHAEEKKNADAAC